MKPDDPSIDDTENALSTTEDSSSARLQSRNQAIRGAILDEEALWERLAKAQTGEVSLEKRLEAKSVYTELADHYEDLGGYEAATRFIKNALAKVDDLSLRRRLAYLEGRVGGYDFIKTYTELLKDSSYNLKLALEFCLALERHDLHESAIEVLGGELRKRLLQTTAPDPEESWLISGFFLLLQVQINTEQQLIIQEYQEVLKANFPEEIVNAVQVSQGSVESTLSGKELEESEEEYGAVQEISKYSSIFFFFLLHYAVGCAIAMDALLLVTMTIFRAPRRLVEHIGTDSFYLLVAYLSFEFIRSFRFAGSARLKAFTRTAKNASAASIAMMVLDFVGPRALGSDARFASTGALKLMSVLLVVSLLSRAYLSIAVIKTAFAKMHNSVLEAFARRTFRSQIANIVYGTSKWSLILQWSTGLYFVANARLITSLFFAVQTAFLAFSWRWAYLELNAEKRKLRDHITFLLTLLFIIATVLEFYNHQSPWEVVVANSIAGLLLLGIGITFALQLTDISRFWLNVCAGLFAVLNFAPLLENATVSLFSLAGIVGSSRLFALTIHTFEAVSILILARIALGARTRVSVQVAQEVYMEAKYKITGGHQGAVGDGAQASYGQGNTGQPKADLSTIANQLAELREELVMRAAEPSEFTSLAQVVSAEKAARAGDEASTIAHIKQFGAWVLDVATKIGVSVVSEMAKSSLSGSH